MSILDAFNHYFEIIPATSDELKQEVYKLRYQVYCVETEFLEAHDDNRIEYDEYDAHSYHYLIRHHATGAYMATTRLIFPDHQNPEKLFPIELHSQIDNIELLNTIHRPKLAELSRFCVSKQFRRRKDDQGLLVTNDALERKSSAHITLALFACAIRISTEHNIDYWYAIMEPALKRVFSSLGIHFIQVGPLVDYHGMRLPCIIKVDDLLRGVAEKDLDYWQMLTNDGEFLKS